MYYEVVFQFSTIAIKDQIDARINVFISNLAKGRYSNPPLGRVGTNEVVCFSGQVIDTLQLTFCRGSDNSKIDYVAPQRCFFLGSGRLQGERDTVSCEQQAVTGAARDKGIIRRELSMVGFENEGQSGISRRSNVILGEFLHIGSRTGE